MKQTLKKGGFSFNGINSLSFSGVKQRLTRIRLILTFKNINKLRSSAEEYLKTIYVQLRQKPSSWSLPSFYNFVILLLVTFIRIQYFPGIEMYKSVFCVMIHRFLINGVEYLKTFNAVQNLINRNFLVRLFMGRKAPEKKVATSTSGEDFFEPAIKDAKLGAIEIIIQSIRDGLSGFNFNKVSPNLAKFIMSILILLLVLYLLEYFFPESIKYQQVVTPFLFSLPSPVKDVLTRLMTFLKEKIPILNNIEMNWNSENSPTNFGSNYSFFHLFLAMLSVEIITTLIYSSVFEQTVQDTEKQITEKNDKVGEDDDL
jgi:hypothetical protein